MTVYTPYKEVWSTIVRDVTYLAPAIPGDPTRYYCTIEPIDPNEIGGATGLKQIGDYLKDFVGSTYTVIALNIGGNPNRVEVSDDQFTGAGPQSGQYAYLYRSVVDGDAPYLSTAKHFFLDKTALDYTRAMELEILWREARHTKPIFNTYTGRDTLLNSSDTLSSYNTANGYSALKYLVDGDYNSAIGAFSGTNVSDDITINRLVSDSYLTLLGYSAYKSSAGAISNSTALGANAYITKSNQIVLGDTNTLEILTSGDYFTRGDKGFFGSYDNNPIGIKTNNTEVITVAVDGTSTFVNRIIAPTINLTNTPTVGYYWKCTSSTTGTGVWAEITSSQTYKGTINASTGIPVGSATPLKDGTGTPGDYYHTSTPGTYDYGNPSGNSITLALGDDIMYSNGGVWQKIEGASYVLQIASGTVLGGVKIGSGVSIDAGGVVSVSTNYQAPLSGTGFVKISGTTINYDNSTYYLASNPNSYTSNLGTVTSVSTSSTATGLSLSGGPITASGTVALGLTAGYSIPTTAQLFPGFGTSGSTAAYGNHLHTGIYEPFLNYPVGNNYILSSSIAGIRTWITPPSGSVTSVGTASNVIGLTLTGGAITSTGTVTLGISGGYSIPTTAQLFPGFGTSGVTAAYGDHTHNYEPFLNYPLVNGYMLTSTTVGVRSWVALPIGNAGTVTSVGTSSAATGLTLTGGTITSSGTITLGLTAGYAIPTAAEISYWNTLSVHPTYTVYNLTLSGATVLATLVTNSIGSVTSVSTRSLTLGDLGFTGASGADYYGYWSLAASGTAGSATIGSGTVVTLSGSGATSATRVGSVVTISSTDTNTWIANAIGTAGYASAAPALASYYYGTNSLSALGWYSLPSSPTSWRLYMNGSDLGNITGSNGFNLVPSTGIQMFNGNSGSWTSITVAAVAHSTSTAGIIPASGIVSNIYYGTNAGGVLGWYAFPSQGGVTTTNALSFSTGSSPNGYIYATSASFNGSAAVTIGVNATTDNIAGAIVARDGSGYAYAQEFYRQSSRATKHGIKDYEGCAVDYLNAVAIKEYFLNINCERSVGFIAEDTDELLSGPTRKFHNFGTHLGIITKAIQEEDSRIVKLEKKVKELEAKLNNTL